MEMIKGFFYCIGFVAVVSIIYSISGCSNSYNTYSNSENNLYSVCNTQINLNDYIEAIQKEDEHKIDFDYLFESIDEICKDEYNSKIEELEEEILYYEDILSD